MQLDDGGGGLRPPPLRRRPYWLLGVFALVMISPIGGSTPALAALVVAAIAFGMAREVVRRRRLSRGRVASSPVVVLGSDRAGREVSLSAEQLSAHGLIVGASGSGKSTTMLRILTEQIRRGGPVVAIDLKGSPAFARALTGAAAAAGRPFRVWSPDGPSHWNPLQHGNATELKDKLIATERFTEPHYQRAAERYVQTVLQVLIAARRDRAPTLEEVVRLMDPRRLTSLLRAVPGPLATRVLDYVAELTPDQLSAIRGLGTRLAVITESHVGRYLAPGEPSQTIDVRAALDGPEVVLFSLNSSSYGTLAAQLGTLAVQDLVTAVGGRMSEAAAGRPLAIMGVDEFSALGGDQLAALFARGREAGVCVLVATQELVDLERAARGLRDQILGNTTVKLVHRQDVPASALMVSQMIGTEMVWEETRQIDSPFGADTGRGTRRPVERFLVHPNTIKTLPRGQAVVIVKEPESSVRIVRVMPPATLERAAGAASLAPARAWDPPGRGGAAEHAGAAHGGASPTRHVDPTSARHIDPSPAARQAAPTPAPARRPPPDRGPELG